VHKVILQKLLVEAKVALLQKKDVVGENSIVPVRTALCSFSPTTSFFCSKATFASTSSFCSITLCTGKNARLLFTPFWQLSHYHANENAPTSLSSIRQARESQRARDCTKPLTMNEHGLQQHMGWGIQIFRRVGTGSAIVWILQFRMAERCFRCPPAPMTNVTSRWAPADDYRRSKSVSLSLITRIITFAHKKATSIDPFHPERTWAIHQSMGTSKLPWETKDRRSFGLAVTFHCIAISCTIADPCRLFPTLSEHPPETS